MYVLFEFEIHVYDGNILLLVFNAFVSICDRTRDESSFVCYTLVVLAAVGVTLAHQLPYTYTHRHTHNG